MAFGSFFSFCQCRDEIGESSIGKIVSRVRCKRALESSICLFEGEGHAEVELSSRVVVGRNHRGTGRAALVAGSIWFFVSKPFQTHVNQAFNQATQWTPENIKKDPVGYLTWALAEVGKTEDKLQASELSLKTKKNATARALEKHTADQSQYEKLLTEFKEAYTTAARTRSGRPAFATPNSTRCA